MRRKNMHFRSLLPISLIMVMLVGCNKREEYRLCEREEKYRQYSHIILDDLNSLRRRKEGLDEELLGTWVLYTEDINGIGGELSIWIFYANGTAHRMYETHYGFWTLIYTYKKTDGGLSLIHI